MTQLNGTGQGVCLFGGTFDPIHKAHLQIAEEARKRFGLTSVVFIPAADPPHKNAERLTPYQDRLRMVEIACAPFPHFSVSRIEENRHPSYTVDTLEAVRKELGTQDRLFFLIGSDAFDELKTWHRWREVVMLAEFIVVERPGGTYHVPPGAVVHRLDGLALPVSSSTVRARLAAGEETPEVPVEVRRFIEEHGLYGWKEQRTASVSD